MFDSLYATGPAPEAADDLMLFGQFVGDWEFDVINYKPDGTKQQGTGEWHFRWVLGGHAVQDVWMVPARSEQAESGKPFTGYGTTVRFLDPQKKGRWHCVWHGIASGQVLQFSARNVGDEIILERQSDDGIGRWIFDQVKPDSFHWRAVESKDAGKRWDLQQEFFVRRPEKKLNALVEYELGWLGDDDPAEVLAATPQKLREIVHGVDDEALRSRPEPDSWSAFELLGHFANIELIHAERFRRILAEDKPRLVPFDPDAWTATFGDTERTPDEHLALFEALRRSNVDLWRRSSAEERAREYIHGERGAESYELLFRMCAGHDRLHMAQMKDALRPRASAGR